MTVSHTKRRYSPFIELKYYALLQIPLAVIVLFYFVVPVLLSEKKDSFFYISLIVTMSFLFARIMFGLLFLRLYKLISQEKYGLFCYSLLFIGLFDFVLGTLISAYTIYRLFKRRGQRVSK